MDIEALIQTIYGSKAADMEKTAEAIFLGGLATETRTVDVNPYDEMSLDELLKIAGAQPAEVTVEATGVPTAFADVDALLDSPNFKTLLGQGMAHATMHERILIKEAVAGGVCRVCKQNKISDSSVCKECKGGK